MRASFTGGSSVRCGEWRVEGGEGRGGEGRQHHVLYTAPYNRKAKPWSNCGRFINEVNVDLLPNQIKGPTWSQTHRSDVPLAAKSASNLPPTDWVEADGGGWRRMEADFAERMRSDRKRTKNSRSTVSLFTGGGAAATSGNQH